MNLRKKNRSVKFFWDWCTLCYIRSRIHERLQFRRGGWNFDNILTTWHKVSHTLRVWRLNKNEYQCVRPNSNLQTRMRSGRMPPVCSSNHLPQGWGVCLEASLPRGCLPWGCLPGRGCLPRGVCPGGVCPSACWDTPPPWTEWLIDRCKNIILPQLCYGQ